MTPAEILRAADGLLSDESKWTQGTFGRTASGVRVGWQYVDAVRLCALGAIYRADGGASLESENDAIRLFARANEIEGDIATWNDSPYRTSPYVKAAFARAIALAEAEEKGGTK